MAQACRLGQGRGIGEDPGVTLISPLPGSGSAALVRWQVTSAPRPGAVCDHEGVPGGKVGRWKTRYSVRLIVPRRGGWRAWGAVRADFERALADPGDPAIAAAEIASEHRRGANHVRVTVAVAVAASDVADALSIAWNAFREAAGDDLVGWEITAAAAEVRPGTERALAR